MGEMMFRFPENDLDNAESESINSDSALELETPEFLASYHGQKANY